MIDAFMRAREYFESSEFKGQRIELREFKAWYAEELGKGSFSYFDDWAAFNMPAQAFDQFERKHKSLFMSERHLHSLAVSLPKDAYIIATSKTCGHQDEYLRHELAHALYAKNKEYRRKVNRVLKRINRKPIFKWLADQKYHSDRFWDEAHSYLLDGAQSLKRELKIDPKGYRRAIKQLQKIFTDYSTKLSCD